MPTPKSNESKKEFIGRCIPFVFSDDKNEEFKVNNSFGSWRELFYPVLSHIKTAEWGYRSRGYLSRWIARNICNAFFECLTEDLIEQKITYRLPYKYLARLSVREMDIFDKKSLRLYRTDLVVMMHKGARRRTGGILYGGVQKLLLSSSGIR